MSSLAVLFALQRVVYTRPPAGSLQRGLLSLPRWPVAAAVVLALAAVAAIVARRRARR